MLPILRILPVGGVFLAIMILVLALDPPGGSRPALPPSMMPARGALLQVDQHPEWRQFLILAAIRRADELSHLRDLPDTPVRHGAAKEDGKFAGLPAERSDAGPDDETGAISATPSLTIPIEIGETSSTELPVIPLEEKPPVIRTPQRTTMPNENRRKTVNRSQRARLPARPESAERQSIPPASTEPH